MLYPSTFTLVNPQNGNLAFKLLMFEDNGAFDHIQRNNYFSLIWIKEGTGICKVDFNEFMFKENSLFSFSPYQPYMLSSETPVKGIAIYFHPDFFCIYKHHKEVSANGVLYNNIYHSPCTMLDTTTGGTFQSLCDQIKTELQNPGLAQAELLVSYLKIFLITAARLKLEQQSATPAYDPDSKEPLIMQKLKDAIELHFKTKHSPGEYAELLFITPKSLAKITKLRFNKTPGELISERIIIEAKRELYLTSKSVKQIAWELGYEDEYYFSRFFKVNTDQSPQLYRETVGFARADL
jgi:AraC family transcriptional activator of pobA